ncbi:MAG TPA: anhydro-N-acetylmuramic acid kinase [Acidobacteriaceae bacterium]
MKQRAMIVAGVMSGTSADGVDVALTRIAPRRGNTPKVELLALKSFSYPATLRRAVLAAMDAPSIATAELARLNWRLGEVYADAVAETLRKYNVQAELVGCHGQTIYHQGVARPYLGKPLRCTWQLGEPALLVERLKIPVVSNFRPADIAAGGQGAPLVPMLDYVLFRDAKRNRVLQNLGGIGNLTVLPAGVASEQVFAFDTGPANMVLDACMQQLFHKPYDRNGAVAERGEIILPAVLELLKDKFFSARPPKSAGREEFGKSYVARLLKLCKKEHAHPEDVIATATALTAWTIAKAYKRFVAPKLSGTAPTEFIVSGGGTRNTSLMTVLDISLKTLNCTVQTTDAFGLPSQAKEATAFALLAWLTLHHEPGNIASATGASRPIILGSITYA